MAGSLGEKIGEGAASDVHSWAPDRVVKLFRAGLRRRVAAYEARMTRAVFAAGAPAPQAFEEVTLEGRHGIVLTRFDGPTLQSLSKTGAMTFEQTGAVLARLFRAVHAVPPPPELPPLRDYLEASFQLNDSLLPTSVASGVMRLIDRLEPADGLCHGDLHSGNVIMTPDGPRIIDWPGVVRGPAALDLACCHVALTELAPAIVPDPERPIAVHAALQAGYARLTGVSRAALAADVERYLPIARVLYLLGGAAPHLREGMIAKVVASLP